MAFITRSSKRLCTEVLHLLLCLAVALLWPTHSAGAQAAGEVTQMSLERTEQGVFLTANLSFELSAPVQDALLRGVAMHFVAEAQVQRDRWYWADKKVASAYRQYRLAYQPLTRRWRLSISAQGAADQAGASTSTALAQSYDSLNEALGAMQRISGWRIANPEEIEPGARHTVTLRFRLDTAQLPRPLLIGFVGQGDWSIDIAHTMRLATEASP